MHPGEVQNGGDLAYPVIAWHRLIEAERIEKLTLILIEPPHHRKPPSCRVALRAVNHGSRPTATDFCNKIGTHSPFAALRKSGSYRGFICRAFSVARPVSLDPYLPWLQFVRAKGMP